MQRTWENDALALWLAAPVSTIPLIPLFSMPSSPLFLGRLMGEAGHPFLWPRLGPWLSAMGVLFDGTLLAYTMLLLIVVPVYLGFRASGKRSVARLVIAFSLAGVIASQVVHVLQGFRQPALRTFAVSWLSLVLGCLCGLAAGLFFVLFAQKQRSIPGRAALYPLPIAVLVACAAVLVWSARVA